MIETKLDEVADIDSIAMTISLSDGLEGVLGNCADGKLYFYHSVQEAIDIATAEEAEIREVLLEHKPLPFNICIKKKTGHEFNDIVAALDCHLTFSKKKIYIYDCGHYYYVLVPEVCFASLQSLKLFISKIEDLHKLQLHDKKRLQLHSRPIPGGPHCRYLFSGILGTESEIDDVKQLCQNKSKTIYLPFASHYTYAILSNIRDVSSINVGALALGGLAMTISDHNGDVSLISDAHTCLICDTHNTRSYKLEPTRIGIGIVTCELSDKCITVSLTNDDVLLPIQKCIGDYDVMTELPMELADVTLLIGEPTENDMRAIKNKAAAIGINKLTHVTSRTIGKIVISETTLFVIHDLSLIIKGSTYAKHNNLKYLYQLLGAKCKIVVIQSVLTNGIVDLLSAFGKSMSIVRRSHQLGNVPMRRISADVDFIKSLMSDIAAKCSICIVGLTHDQIDDLATAAKVPLSTMCNLKDKKQLKNIEDYNVFRCSSTTVETQHSVDKMYCMFANDFKYAYSSDHMMKLMCAMRPKEILIYYKPNNLYNAAQSTEAPLMSVDHEDDFVASALKLKRHEMQMDTIGKFEQLALFVQAVGGNIVTE